MLFRRLPIKRNRLLFINYYGKGYGCNPKYISEYICKHYADKIEICWALNHNDVYIHLPYNTAPYASIKFLYYLATSKLICTNYRMTLDFVKRPNQIYFQTWHSSLRLKMIEADVTETLPKKYVEMAKHDSAQTDYVVAGCEMSANTFENSFWYKGNIIKCGTPRNDLLINANYKLRQRILQKLNISGDKRIVLYAPTFREDKQLHYYDLNFNDLRDVLASRFGGEWQVLLRLHPHLSGLGLKGKDVVNVTNYDDIQELLLVSDVLVTDYSSLMFDFAITKRPVFLYAKDLEQYTKKERKLYFDIRKLPFLLAQSGSELIEEIQNFSETEYLDKLEEFNQRVGTYENGSASRQIGDLMIKLTDI